MNRKSVILLHGFASSSQGTKAQFLRQKFQSLHEVDFHAIDFNPTPRDFEFMTVTGMINRLRQFILERQLQDVRLIGSSMGALVGLNYTHRFGSVRNLLLLAPALSYHFGAVHTTQADVEFVFHYAFDREVPLRFDFEMDGRQYGEVVPPSVPTLIVHGRSDDILPITDSQAYATTYSQQVRLIEVDSDHRLNDQLDFIWQQVLTFSLR